MKRLIKKTLNKFGIDIVKYNQVEGKWPFEDIAKFVKSDNPMVFDVGANTGQTVQILRQYFQNSTIHSFEPNQKAYKLLKQNTSKIDKVYTWNYGLGSTIGETTFFENSFSDMSSFLKLGEIGWGQEKETTVQVITVDQFCADQKIEFIDLLKIDTQGFELEILKGAESVLLKKAIGLIYLEVIFSKMYEDLPSFGDIYNFLVERGYRLVSIYPMHYQDNLASWSDVLFVHESYV